MIDCDKFRSKFSSYLEGELSIEQRKEVEAHFSQCSDCHETFRQVRIIRQSLRQIPQISTDPDFEQKLHQEIFNSEQRTNFVPLPLQNWKLPAMGSAIVLATLGLFFVFNNTTDTMKPVNNSQQPINSHASPQISVGKSSNNPTQMQAPQFEKSTIIQDSLDSDTNQVGQEGFLQVGGNR